MYLQKKVFFPELPFENADFAARHLFFIYFWKIFVARNRNFGSLFDFNLTKKFQKMSFGTNRKCLFLTVKT